MPPTPRPRFTWLVRRTLEGKDNLLFTVSCRGIIGAAANKTGRVPAERDI